MNAKILIFDIENGPIIGTAWDIYETNLIWTVQDWYMFSWAAKWYGKKGVMCKALPDFKRYKRDRTDDYDVVKGLRDLVNEADIVVAHNARAFDVKKLNARCLVHGIEPPKPYAVVDTLTEARARFKLTSNKLDALGHTLGVGRKIVTTGKHLWKACMDGDKKAWQDMKRYNKQDVLLLERVYEKLLPWMKHPNIGIITGSNCCPRCGSKSKQSRGMTRAASSTRLRYQCNDCLGWYTGEPEKAMKVYTR